MSSANRKRTNGKLKRLLAQRWSVRHKHLRRGQSTVDYVLILAVIMPAVAFCLWAGPRIMRLVYEFACVVIGWPMM